MVQCRFRGGNIACIGLHARRAKQTTHTWLFLGGMAKTVRFGTPRDPLHSSLAERCPDPPICCTLDSMQVIVKCVTQASFQVDVSIEMIRITFLLKESNHIEPSATQLPAAPRFQGYYRSILYAPSPCWAPYGGASAVVGCLTIPSGEPL